MPFTIQWSNKIPVRDKFPAFWRKGMLLWTCLEPTWQWHCVCTVEIFFPFIQPRQKGEASQQNFKVKGWKNCSPSLNLKPQRCGQWNLSFVLLDNPWLLTSSAEWAICLKPLWAWNLLGRFVGLRTVYLQEISLLGADGGGWVWSKRVHLRCFFGRELSKQSSFMSNCVFPG